MYNSSTDAYQAAAKIMSHEYANKYANYWSKKNKVIKTGKANFKDSGRQKTYNAEFAAIAEWKHRTSIQTAQVQTTRLETLKSFSRRLQSRRHIKTYVSKRMRHVLVVRTTTLELAHFRGATAGQATYYGAMRLQETNCPYTIIHEFAHLCGNMHHDIGFAVM